MDIFDELHRLINLTDPDKKCEDTLSLSQTLNKGTALTGTGKVVPIPVAGVPRNLKLVAPRLLKKRGIQSPEGRLILFHAIAHIEFNAINLALDAAYRFRDLPNDYYHDWIGVAADESRHFQLIKRYLAQHGCEYGDYPAHNGLWDMALKTQDDIVARMALVPRVMEARGLDVTPAMIERLKSTGDQHAVNILESIYHEEIEHVRIGSKWYQYVCSKKGLDSESTFFKLVKKYHHGVLKGPFNIEARREAGFSENELNSLD